MAPKQASKRPRDEETHSSVNEAPRSPSDDRCATKQILQEAEDHEDALIREGSKLSGAKLRDFLKKNFLDFADEEFKKIETLRSDKE